MKHQDLEADVLCLQKRLAYLESSKPRRCVSHVIWLEGATGIKIHVNAMQFWEFMLERYCWSQCFPSLHATYHRLLEIPQEHLCWHLPAADFMALSMTGCHPVGVVGLYYFGRERFRYRLSIVIIPKRFIQLLFKAADSTYQVTFNMYCSLT